MAQATVIEAVRTALDEAMAADDRIFANGFDPP